MANLADIARQIAAASKVAKQGGTAQQAKQAATQERQAQQARQAPSVSRAAENIAQNAKKAVAKIPETMFFGQQQRTNGAPKSNASNEPDEKYYETGDGERKRAAWHQSLDEALGTEGVGGFVNDIISYSPVVAAADIMLPEWALNHKKVDGGTTASDAGPGQVVRDNEQVADPWSMSMPSGEQLSQLSPEEREQWQELTTQGLGLSAAAALGALPGTGELIGAKPVTEKLASAANPVNYAELLDNAGNAVYQEARKGSDAAMNALRLMGENASKANAPKGLMTAKDAAKAAGQEADVIKAAEAGMKPVKESVPGETTANWLKQALAYEAPKAAEEAAAETGSKISQKAMDRALKNIDKKIGKRPEIDYGRAYDKAVAERFGKQPEDIQNTLSQAIEKAVEKNRGVGKTPIGEDYSVAMGLLDKAVRKEARGPARKLALGTAGLATALGGATAAENPAFSKAVASLFGAASDQESGPKSDKTVQKHTVNQPKSLNQGDSYREWVANNPAFIEAWGDDLKSYEAFRELAEENPDLLRDVFGYGDYEAIPGWVDLYTRSGVTFSDDPEETINNLVKYFANNKANIYDYILGGNTNYDLIGHGTDYGNAMRYFYDKYGIMPTSDQYGYMQRNAGTFNADDMAYYGLLSKYSNSNPMTWDLNILNDVAHKAGEKNTFGLTDEGYLGLLGDDGKFYFDQGRADRGIVRPYNLSDFYYDNLNGAMPYGYDENALMDMYAIDTLLNLYNDNVNSKKGA